MKQGIEWHETYKCKCKLDANVCNNRQRWNNEKCRCECRELIDKGRCDTVFIWNPNGCDCQYDKSRDVEQYLDYKNCKCRKKIVDELVEKCSKNIDGNEMIYNGTVNDYEDVCNSCEIYIVLFVIFLIISTSSSSVFIYFRWYLKRSDTNTIANINTNNETVIY